MAHKLAVSHILSDLQRHTQRYGSCRHPPLFVAVQGPQGSGKTYLANNLRRELTFSHSLSVAVLSIDDLYLPHSGLVEVAKAHPNNRLLQGRGLPGTHDITLGSHLLQQLKQVNDDETATTMVDLPYFDKSLFNGEGDRSSSGSSVSSPVDVVIFEGWFVGFAPIRRQEIIEKHAQEIPDLKGLLDVRSFTINEIAEVNEMLKDYVAWWRFFDTFIQIKPPQTHPYSYIYSWRLQQEHTMKTANGGIGMTDEQVQRFVDRYIPGYVFFASGIGQGHRGDDGEIIPPTWKGNGLAIIIDKNREVIDSNQF